jgi:hypothetical protein
VHAIDLVTLGASFVGMLAVDPVPDCRGTSAVILVVTPPRDSGMGHGEGVSR